MSSIYDWQKQAEEMSKTLNVLSPLLNQVNVMGSARTLSTALGIVRENLDIANSVSVLQTTLGTWSRQFEIYEALREIDVAKMFTVSEAMKKVLASFDFSAVLQNMPMLDYVGEISASLQAYDVSKFSSAIESVLDRLNWTDTVQLSDIVEQVTEEYIEENELDEEASEEIREVATAKNGKHLTEQQRKVWEVYIYPFLLSFCFFILGLLQAQPITTNSITEINNYYTVEFGIDADALNEFNYRIICEDDVMPRIKPDCSSRVVEHLPVGKLVFVVNKYRKWIQITWQNEDGEYCSGWIQNYKAQKFK